MTGPVEPELIDHRYDAVTPWQNPEWRAGAERWIADSLAAHGLAVTAVPAVRLRPWSVVMRVPTTGGTVWFKASPPGSAFEPGLTRALADWSPGSVLTPLAVDTVRAWSLLPDGGRTLRDVLDQKPDVRLWEAPLGRYARLQRTLADRVGDLLALGVPDTRPAAVAERVPTLIADPARRAEALALCAALADGGIAASLDHADLHDNNVLTSGSTGSDDAAFYDWGDATVAHPFTSLLVTVRVTRERFGWGPDEPDLHRLTDAYPDPGGR